MSNRDFLDAKEIVDCPNEAAIYLADLGDQTPFDVLRCQVSEEWNAQVQLIERGAIGDLVATAWG